MTRRKLIALLGSTAVTWPLGARAQQPERVRRIGVLQGLATNDPEGQARFEAFLQALEQLGWTDGRNIQIVHRWTDGDAGRTVTVTAHAPTRRNWSRSLLTSF
jgi:putative ABC transport system substrate-binding protein